MNDANLGRIGAYHDVPEVDDEEVERRKAFLEFRDEDAHVLESLRDLFRSWADSVTEEFYAHMLAFDETRSFFRDPEVLARQKPRQEEYFLRLAEGDYGAEYVAQRLRIGAAHEEVELEPKWYLGMYAFYLRLISTRLQQAFASETQAFAALSSILKLVFFDMSLAVDTYIHAREATVRKQQEAIRELSIPVLQLRERLLLLPIIGVVDTHRARLLTDTLLRVIRDTRAKVVVMDVTGVAVIDTKVADHLIQTVAAARLTGAEVIVTGLSSEVSQALVALGLDVSGLNTVGDLQGGIAAAERVLGVVTVARSAGRQSSSRS